MPWLFKTCAYPGCDKKVKDSKESYCSEHLKERRRWYEQNQRDPESKRFYNSRAWLNLRKVKLNQSPLCEECLLRNEMVAATTADHIKDMRSGGDPCDINNLQSLCASCHSKKHSIDGTRWKNEKTKT